MCTENPKCVSYHLFYHLSPFFLSYIANKECTYAFSVTRFNFFFPYERITANQTSLIINANNFSPFARNWLRRFKWEVIAWLFYYQLCAKAHLYKWICLCHTMFPCVVIRQWYSYCAEYLITFRFARRRIHFMQWHFRRLVLPILVYFTLYLLVRPISFPYATLSFDYQECVRII